MQDLTITLIQSDLHWQNIEANLAMFEEKIWLIDQKTDLIVLPEMFTTGFTMEAAALAEPVNSKTFRWLKQLSAQTGAVITGSAIIKEGGKFYNRLIWMEPDGSFSTYDKRHLFRMANEQAYYNQGTEKLIKEIKGWKICPLICYDLRFPVWSRNTGSELNELSYDLLLYVANWPAARSGAWDILLKARAVENLSFVAGVNRVGQDGKGNGYNGHSALYNFKGEEIWFNDGEEVIQTITISKKELNSFREKFPAYMDGDKFNIEF